MILKRPYAFLIKNFKLIHIIITALMIYLSLQVREIYTYINEIIKDNSLKYNALSYINNSVYIYIFILLILFLTVFFLLRYKDKPRKIYILLIISYTIIGLFMYILNNYFNIIVNNIIEQKTIRMYKDITTIILFFQYLMTILMGIRGLGFNLKKFDFDKELENLNITSEDSEEVILDVNLNTQVATRYLRKQKREFSYFFKEYRVILISIIFIIIIFLGIKYYNIYQKQYKIYEEGTDIGINNIINIKNSYYDNKNNIIIINFTVFKSGKKEKLILEKMQLLQGNDKYYPTKNICSNYNDIANCYKQQYVTNTEENYIITYDVNNINMNNAYLVYKENDSLIYKVKLNLKKYEK